MTGIKEHERSQIFKDGKRLSGKHLHEHTHEYVDLTDKHKILTSESNPKKRKLQEQIEIIKIKLINITKQFNSEPLSY